MTNLSIETCLCLQIDNTADWHLAQKLQIYLSSAIDRYGVNMLKQNEPSTAEKSPPYPQGEQHQTPDNHSTRSLYRIAPEGTSSNTVKLGYNEHPVTTNRMNE